jgi:hypothetical protein
MLLLVSGIADHEWSEISRSYFELHAARSAATRPLCVLIQ